jgi:hypothetical protein
MRRTILSALSIAAATCALAAVPGGAVAATPKACGDVPVSNDGGAFTYLGVKATNVACSTAKQLLKKTAKTSAAPKGWTFGDTSSKFDQKTNTATCGFFIKHGKKRITWHTSNEGGGC